MKTKWIIICIYLLANVLDGYSQIVTSKDDTIENNILLLKEESTTGKFRGIINEEDQGIVDIHSIIRIQLNIDSIETEMMYMAGVSATNDRLKKLRRLNSLLKYEQEILRILTDYFQESESITLEQRKEWATLSNEFTDKFAEVLPDLDEEIFKNPESPKYKAMMAFEGDIEEYLLIVIKEEGQKIRKDLSKEYGLIDGDSSSLIYFRLGAFIKNRQGGRPIHVENFDDIAQEAFYEIQRFEASVSKTEFEELQNHATLSNSLESQNNQAIQSFKLLAKKQIAALTTSKKIFESIDAQWTDLKDTLEKQSVENATIQAIDNKLSAFNLSSVHASITTIVNELSTSALRIPNSGIISENNINTLTADLNRDFPNPLLSSELKQQIIGHASQDKIESIETTSQELQEAIRKDVKNIREFLEQLKMTLGLKKSSLENEAFSEKVNRFTIGNIPREGFIELKHIGERHPGDEILIKAVIEKGTDKHAKNFKQKEIYRRYLSLARIVPYVKMSASLILANPYNRENNPKVSDNLETKHQFAASYGVFLKWGSRKSKFYNNYIDFGLGLNFASPDFSLEGTPEFGAGIMLTAFKDWVNVGWGWNFGVDAPYSFIGFNIPFTVGGFGASAANLRDDF